MAEYTQWGRDANTLGSLTPRELPGQNLKLGKTGLPHHSSVHLFPSLASLRGRDTRANVRSPDENDEETITWGTLWTLAYNGKPS